MARPVSTRDACGDLRDKRDDNCSFLDPETVEGIEVGLKAGTAAGVGSGDGEGNNSHLQPTPAWNSAQFSTVAEFQKTVEGVEVSVKATFGRSYPPP
jgi:hypothetical protein